MFLQVSATDRDTGAFGQVRYSIDGEGSDVFEIGPRDGVVRVRANQVGRSNLDREKQSGYTLKVVASDMPEGGPDQVWPLSNSFFVCFCKKSLICLEGKSMTPHRGNTSLFHSSQQLPRLRLRPSKGFLS